MLLREKNYDVEENKIRRVWRLFLISLPFSVLVLLFLFQFSKITLVRVFVGIAKIYHQKLLKLNSKKETFPLRINVV
jgi:hypothetical protein